MNLNPTVLFGLLEAEKALVGFQQMLWIKPRGMIHKWYKKWYINSFIITPLKNDGANGLVEELVEGLVESQKKILDLVKGLPSISKKELAGHVGISETAVDKNIAQLKKKGLLKRIGPDKGGHWEIRNKS